MEKCVHHADKREVMGDLSETYKQHYLDHGTRVANRWYLNQVLRSLPTFLLLSSFWSLVMFKNYLKVAVRHFRNHTAFSVINVFGLSLGLASAFFILLWVQDELKYDQFHSNGDRIYRVLQHSTTGGVTRTSDSLPQPLDAKFEESIPEIEHSVLMDWGTTKVISTDDKTIRADGRYFDPEVFQVFTYPLILGSPASALVDPESITISESLAESLFGPQWQRNESILGTTIRVDDRIDVELTGVFEDVPDNASIQFDFVMPVQEFIRRTDWVDSWGSNGLLMFVELREDADINEVNAKVKDLIDEHVDSWDSDVWLQPLFDMHLRSGFENGTVVGGRIENVRTFGLVAGILILIACINFMNLSTARCSRRAREIGVRKSVGASRSLLAKQLLGESILMALIAYTVAVSIVVFLLPGFNDLTEKNIGLTIQDSKLWIQFLGIALLTGVMAGIYPAIFLSSFNVVGILRNRTVSSSGGGIRRGLVVVQFAMSIVLIVGTVTIYKQLDYIRTKDLGVDRHNVLYLNVEGDLQNDLDLFKNELIREASIQNVAAASQNPLSTSWSTVNVQWPGKDPEDKTWFFYISADSAFVKVMNVGILKGRSFNSLAGSAAPEFLLNETALKLMQLEQPIGERITFRGTTGEVVGIVKDFHVRSLSGPLRPVILIQDPSVFNMLFIRVGAGKTTEALAALAQVYSKFNAGIPLNYRFLDDEFEESYQSEIVVGNLSRYFGLISILIACLGLYGLSIFATEKRKKEIGIRKAVGASIPSVVLMLTREFLTLIVGAFLIAAPVSYMIMRDWLNDYAFHTNLGISTFILAGIASLAIAGLSVSWQSFKAASVSPIQSLNTD